MVVAGEDFDGNAMPMQSLERARRGVLGRIEERDVASKYQVPLIIPHADLLSRQYFAGHGQHAEAVVAQTIVFLLQPDDAVRVHGGQIAVELELRTAQEHLFRRALSEKNRLA